MQNMKLFSRRVTLTHASVVLSAAVLVSMFNYLVWTYQPDTRIETLETVLWPFARPILSLITLALFVTIAFDPHTVRVLRKLSYFNENNAKKSRKSQKL
ncbi:hypothetical protein [Flavobacterium sp.]|uniref:hypothetical protein n=1 Tax=Flavobacterium sp. TaxID=239 RepID=UPI0026090303|nr:hypothetical protein [Flavobacterium sp.]